MPIERKLVQSANKLYIFQYKTNNTAIISWYLFQGIRSANNLILKDWLNFKYDWFFLEPTWGRNKSKIRFKTRLFFIRTNFKLNNLIV